MGKPQPEFKELFPHPICANCKKDITKRRYNKAKKDGWLPLCKPCDILLKAQLEKCAPLMKKITGGGK